MENKPGLTEFENGENFQRLFFEIGKASADIIRQSFAKGTDIHFKPDRSIVTDTDIEINKLVIRMIKEQFPNHAIKGEEESDLSGDSEHLWLCDPIDGTTPFSHGVPTSVFELALTEKGIAVAGMAIDPYLNRTLYAEKGKGCALNGEPTRVSEVSELDRSLVDLECFKFAKYDLSGIYGDLYQIDGTPTIYNSLGYGGSMVAMGKAEGAIFPHTTNHDVAALKVLVEEAGGRVTDLFGNEFDFRQSVEGAVISNGIIHDQLLELVKKHIKIQNKEA